MRPIRLLWLAAGWALLVLATTDAEPQEETKPSCRLGHYFGRFFMLVAVVTRVTQLVTAAQQPGSCVFGNGTLREGTSTPDPSGACAQLTCKRDNVGNLTVNIVTCSNVALENDFEREGKIYPFCCPYPDVEENV